jgi:hypothetical protein
MATRKGGENQFTGIGVARMNGQSVTIFNRLDDFINVRKVEPGVDPLCVHVERNCDEIDITGPFTIAKQASFDPVRPGEQAKFGCGDARAAIIVGMQADDHPVAVRDVTAEIFDLVGVNVGRCCLHRRG